MTDPFLQSLFCKVLFSGSYTCTDENCKKGIFEGLDPAICCSLYCCAGKYFPLLCQIWGTKTYLEYND